VGALTIEFSTLQAVIQVLITEIEKRFGSSIKFKLDYYWQLPPRQAYDLVDEPRDHIQSGQVSEDIEELREVLQRPTEEIVIWHDLEHLLGVLGAIVALDTPE
jgi:hypothetical protein